MASRLETGKADEAGLSVLDRFADQLAEYRDNFSRNVSASISAMTLQSWIRIVVIVGGYMLLRPYVMKFFAKQAVRDMQQQDVKAKAQLSPNELRGEKAPPPELDEEDEGDGTGADWGQRARIRQRVMLKQLLEAEEKRREEEDEDKDIADLLVD